MKSCYSLIKSLISSSLLLIERASGSNTSCIHAPEDHGAVLPVEGEVVDSDGTSTAVDGGRQPVHAAIRRHQCVAVKCYLELSIHAVCRREQARST